MMLTRSNQGPGHGQTNRARGVGVVGIGSRDADEVGPLGDGAGARGDAGDGAAEVRGGVVDLADTAGSRRIAPNHLQMRRQGVGGGRARGLERSLPPPEGARDSAGRKSLGGQRGMPATQGAGPGGGVVDVVGIGRLPATRSRGGRVSALVAHQQEQRLAHPAGARSEAASGPILSGTSRPGVRPQDAGSPDGLSRGVPDAGAARRRYAHHLHGIRRREAWRTGHRHHRPGSAAGSGATGDGVARLRIRTPRHVVDSRRAGPAQRRNHRQCRAETS